MRRQTRLALGVLAIAVVGLHLGLLGGLRFSALGADATSSWAMGAPPLHPGPSPSALAPDPPPAPVVLLADAGRSAVFALPAAEAPMAAPAPSRVVAPGPAPASAPSPAPAAASAPSRPASRPAAAVSRPAPSTAASAAQASALPAPPVAESATLAPAQRASEPPGAASGVAAEPHGPAAALPPLPVYRTRIPPAARIAYRLSRGMIVGTGELDWRPQAGSFQIRLEGKLPLIGTLITQTSRGRIDAAGLAPERHTDQRLRRSEQAANFQRELGLVSFSGGARPVPLAPGLQDRLSVMVQLAAIAAAGPQPPPAGQTVSIGVVGARGDAALWVLRFEGVQAIETPDGPVKAWRYLRQPESPHETVAEFWLDPTLQFLPVRVKLTDGSSEPLELRRQSHEP